MTNIETCIKYLVSLYGFFIKNDQKIDSGIEGKLTVKP